MKLISMSVYGKHPMYYNGAIKNAQLLKQIYPGWILRIYCSPEIDWKTLQKLGCQIIQMGMSLEHSGMFWRFLPAWENDVDVVIFRDSDSRLNVKEAVAVNEWLNTNLKAHCMHDHEHHKCYPIFGGMWGVKKNTISKKVYSKLLNELKKKQKRVADMNFITKNIWPELANSILRHSSVSVIWPHKKFPHHPAFSGFVGEQHVL